jgi:(2Fe-2S) ferredoxin
MSRFCQIFVCATPGEGRCGSRGGDELLEKFRREVERHGISSNVVLRNACARRHERGPVVFVYPDDVWYERVSVEQVPDIVERHLGAGEPSTVDRAGPEAVPSPSRKR